ncbi:hypothetical protein LIER_39381 [Lithospermum erythrorhizon]|uniref:Uncharacterized protein n=1 Tax=Lithospermum erythrorhizon TaxID=34254 RepID=A0AAV3QG68_LITER
MKGKRLPWFSAQLLIRKPLAPGATPTPIFPFKRTSISDVSTSTSKKAKIEALTATTASSSSPSTRPTEIISLDDELTASAQEACRVRKEKSVLPSSMRSSKAIL